ncbi:fungal hydrophobin-domain-containing protein [Cyathus striatus]|nr:fungal hydrophobin-domain-containing protein [Cyathus striatus]
MLAHSAALFVFALPLLAAASAVPRTDSPQCNTGPVQCCNSLQSADSKEVTTLAGLLGIVLTGVTGLVGVNCSPISGVGVGGTSCNAQPVCCNGNNFNGVIVVGCSPIIINA